jgi:hypothetical protein
LRHLLGPFVAAGWAVADVLWAVDHTSAGGFISTRQAEKALLSTIAYPGSAQRHTA